MIVKNVMIWDVLMYIFVIDVFNKGWGVVYGNQLIGFWFFYEKSYYINYFEFLGFLVVYLGLKVFCSLYWDMYISFRIDNIIVVVVINYMGMSYLE